MSRIQFVANSKILSKAKMAKENKKREVLKEISKPLNDKIALLESRIRALESNKIYAPISPSQPVQPLLGQPEYWYYHYTTTSTDFSTTPDLLTCGNNTDLNYSLQCSG